MPDLNEEEMVATAQARAKGLSLDPLPDNPGVYVRYRLTAGIVIPYTAVVEWDKRISLALYPDETYEPRPIWICLGDMITRYGQLAGDLNANPFVLVSAPFTQGRHDIMLVMATKVGEWTNKNARWCVEHVFDPTLQFPPMPEREKELRGFLTDKMGLDNLGDFITIFRHR